MQTENNKKREQDKFAEELAAETESDFEARRKARLPLERQWELNMNFVKGNQYCDVKGSGAAGEDREYFWQNREVFNHVAPLLESRLARFSKISPIFAVRPDTDDDADLNAAAGAEKLIASAFERINLQDTVRKVTVWSETCGSGFYKVLWNENGGAKVGESQGGGVYEGDLSVTAVSPFEIFPDNLFAEAVEDCFSIIQARAMPVSEIKKIYGTEIKGGEVNVLSLKKDGTFSGVKESEGKLADAAVVIEKYEKPSQEFPNGRIITVAGGKLLYYGELPYINGESGARTFPFIKQDSISSPGSFFGTGVVERLIPVQRAFNAVKNRKHEFLNRLSMGVIKVEDGSVDVSDLEEEGLPPGKILVYRQGSAAPEMMQDLSMPSDFKDEEEKLANEFVIISGVSDVSSSSTNAGVTSGSALELLIAQDNERLLLPAEEIRSCYARVAKHAIRLYRQFSAGPRAVKFTDTANKTKVIYVDGKTLASDDVYVVNENELLYSENSKRDTVFKLYESGLLADGSGKIRQSVKEKALALLGYKELDYGKGLTGLQEEKARAENAAMRTMVLSVEEVDDDAIHVDEHSRYFLSEYAELKEEEKERFFTHIKEHKKRLKETEV